MPHSLLKNKKGIIFGALDDKSIAWKVARLVKEEGGDIILTNAPVALRMGEINKLGEELNSPVLPADATKISELESLIQQAHDHFNGKFDFVLHSIGMSLNVRKKRHYTNQNHDWTHKGWDISALSFHKLLQVLQ